MTEQTSLEPAPTNNPLRCWGFWAVITGAAALILVFFQVFGPTLQPTPSVGEQIGEIAGDIKRSAWRSFLGLSAPEPEPVPVTNYLAVIAPICGVVAIVLSLLSAIRGENKRFLVYGSGLGITAIVFHFFWWMALVFVGALIIIAIIENIGDIFSF